MTFAKNIFILFIFLKSFLGNSFAHSSLSINGVSINSSLQSNAIKDAINSLETSILQKENYSGHFLCLHVIKNINRSEREITLEDDSVWKISYWDRNDYNDWNNGDRVRVYTNERLENVDKSNNIKASLEKWPSWDLCDSLLRNTSLVYNYKKQQQVILQNGGIFVGPLTLSSWKILDPIVVSCISGNQYELWNVKRNETTAVELIGNEKESFSPSILHFEERVNEQILGQKEAVRIVKNAMFNYWNGLNNPKNPIGVFLFLGPSGVGKTELAKVLCNEIFHSLYYLTRFDMSHFSEAHSVSRLIGSPPGYIGYDEGGQLSKAIMEKPHSIILLDEMEKAHPFVHKFFLPVFDEGYLNDSRNRRISCTQSIFVMTSNIGALEISEYFHQGYTSEEILQKIEPILMKTLSPELYNRVVPIIFRPLSKDLMESLVELALKEISQRLKAINKMHLVVEKEAKKYLAIHGFHPTLGARPLQKLIQQKITTQLSYVIITESIPENKTIVMDYCPFKDQWKIIWY